MLYTRTRQQAVRDYLTHGRKMPKAIPFVDSRLKRYAGHPGPIARKISKRTVKMARRFVNTVAFEHIVDGAFNPKSQIRKYFTKKRAPIIVF